MGRSALKPDGGQRDGVDLDHARNRQDAADAQRRRVRRTAILLGLVALGIYVAFIASGVMQARG